MYLSHCCISSREFFMRVSMISWLSVPLPVRRFRSSASLSGMTKSSTRDCWMSGSVQFLIWSAPWTSISMTTSLPDSIWVKTSDFRVP